MEHVIYHSIIPKSLHQHVDRLFHYLREFPYLKPTICPYCASKSFKLGGYISKQGILSYECNYCNKGFNQLTNTIFARCQLLDQWVDFTQWYFSGLSLLEISHQTNISRNGCKLRETRLLVLMQEREPALFNWWVVHHNRKDLSMNSTVEVQKTNFLNWLKALTDLNNINCPHCGSSSFQRVNQIRPQFACWKCLKTFNPFAKTSLKNMHHIHLWPVYFERLTAGFTHFEISNELPISRSCSMSWRSNFIKQMQIMKLYELAQWMDWQHKRSISLSLQNNEQ